MFALFSFEEFEQSFLWVGREVLWSDESHENFEVFLFADFLRAFEIDVFVDFLGDFEVAFCESGYGLSEG